MATKRIRKVKKRKMCRKSKRKINRSRSRKTKLSKTNMIGGYEKDDEDDDVVETNANEFVKKHPEYGCPKWAKFTNDISRAFGYNTEKDKCTQSIRELVSL